MITLVSRVASLILWEAATVAAFLFVLAVVTEPLWQALMWFVVGGGR